MNPTPALGGATLPDAIERAASADPALYGFRFLDRDEKATWLPFGDFAARVAATAGALWDEGVRAGDRVALILPTCPEFIEIFFAAQWLGAIPVALYPPVRLGRLDEYHERTAAMLRAVGASVLYTDARIGRILGETVARYRPRLGVRQAAGLRGGVPRGPGAVSPDAIAMVQFSSGTTVDPKPVALTHAQMLANGARITEAIFTLLPPSQGNFPGGVSWLPLYHDMGLIGCLVPALWGPGPLTLISPELFVARPAIWLRAIARYRGTTSPAPNFAYALCADRVRDQDLEGCDLSCWRMALNGAEPMSAATLRAFEKRFEKFGFRRDALMPVYGLSEATLAVTFTRPGTRWRSRRFDAGALARGIAKRCPGAAGEEDDWGAAAGRAGAADDNNCETNADEAAGASADTSSEWVSSGVPLPGFTVEIRDEDGNVLGPQRVGRILARGPSVMQGYYGRSDSPVRDGWLDTGDLGFVDEGQLYVTGRAKDVLVLRGQNQAPHELERAVDGVPGVRVGCAAAVADVGAGGERLLLFVEVRDVHAAAGDLAEACREAVLGACGMAVDEVVALPPGTLPRTSSGKIRRGETLRLWKAAALAPPDAVNALMLGAAMLRSQAGYARSALGQLRRRWRRSGEAA
ncbi:MAG: AMP-binding protein [Deltaproteobacteria bacterium]|nr:AMP-binding protein [Deltaproteobacteria bacterium]